MLIKKGVEIIWLACGLIRNYRYQVVKMCDYRDVWYDNKSIECWTCGSVQTNGKQSPIVHISLYNCIHDSDVMCTMGYDCKPIDWLSCGLYRKPFGLIR